MDNGQQCLCCVSIGVGTSNTEMYMLQDSKRTILTWTDLQKEYYVPV